MAIFLAYTPRADEQQVQRRLSTFAVRVLLFVAGLLLFASIASAQSVLKKVALDPTTWVPAATYYAAEMQDWNTSQPFFQHGWHEWNKGFTQEGVNNGTAVSYSRGMTIMRKRAGLMLAGSIANNVWSQKAFVNHKKLSVAERLLFNGIVGFYLSRSHFVQASDNRAAMDPSWKRRWSQDKR